MKLRTLLVDDEPLALERLHDLLAEDPDLEILGHATNGLQALETIRSHKPELIFLDIQMPELDGFEVLEALQPDEMPLVVFATAYDRHAIRAFEARALDYLLKPFSLERLRETTRRAKEFHSGQEAKARLHGLVQDLETSRKDRFVVRHGERFLVIPAGDIDAIEAEANYMWIHRGRDTFPLRATLATLEKSLDPSLFVRAHRSWMLNVQKIRELLPGTKGGLLAVTASGIRVPVSAGHRKDVEARLA